MALQRAGELLLVKGNKKKGRQNKTQATKAWKGVYPFIDKDPSKILDKEVLFHIVCTCEASEETHQVSPMWYLVPIAWVDMNKKYFIYPPPSFRISNQRPDKWSKLTLKRNFYPQSTWEENKVDKLGNNSKENIAFEFKEAIKLLKRLKSPATINTLRDTDSDKQFGGPGTRIRNVKLHEKKINEAKRFLSAAPSDDSSDQGNNSASSVTPLKEKAYTNETSCEATHVSFSDMGKPHNSGRKITFEENVSEIREKERSVVDEQEQRNLTEQEENRSGTNKVNCEAIIENNFPNSNSDENILGDATGAEKSNNGQEPPISNHEDLHSQVIYEEDVHASQQSLNLPDFDQSNTAQLPIPDESDSSSSSSSDQEFLDVDPRARNLLATEVQFDDIVVTHVMNTVMGKLSKIEDRQAAFELTMREKFGELCDTIQQFIARQKTPVAITVENIYATASSFVKDHVNLPLTSVEQIAPFNCALQDNRLAVYLCATLIKDVDAIRDADTIVNLIFKTIFTEETAISFQWKCRKNDVRFEVYNLYNLLAVFVVVTDQFYSGMPPSYDRNRLEKGIVSLTIYLFKKARKIVAHKTNLRCVQQANEADMLPKSANSTTIMEVSSRFKELKKALNELII